MGKRADALTMLDRLHELARRRYVSSFNLAIVYAGLGDRDQALTALERAAEERSSSIAHLKVDPRFDALREDRRFRKLLLKAGLARP